MYGWMDIEIGFITSTRSVDLMKRKITVNVNVKKVKVKPGYLI